MRSLKEKVKFCLEKYPQSRNSDTLLCQLVWYEFFRDKIIEVNGKAGVLFENMHLLPKETIIVRWRQKFNEQDKYLATDPEVIEQRSLKQEKVLAELGYLHP